MSWGLYSARYGFEPCYGEDHRYQPAGAQGNRQLLEKEVIFAGLSSGAVAYQANRLAGEMGEGNMVTVLADGGWKYLSMDIWSKIG